jgi:hypothetical protein
MKPQIRSLRHGEKVWALIEEVLEGSELMVNFSGDLIRIFNGSDRTFRAGQRVLLMVENLEPLKFKLITRQTFANGHASSLDINI